MKLWGGDRRHGQQEDLRVVETTSNGHPAHYSNNYISTCKYSLITFLPKSLFEQYRRLANIYFTLVAALSLTKFSPIRPWTTWTPLVIVLAVSLVKEALEDYKRHKADKEVNSRTVKVLDKGSKQFVDKAWKNVRVGDIVLVYKNEFFPADLLFLSAETEEGSCYIETMNLDGETNLKIKTAPDHTKGLTRDSVSHFSCRVRCEAPNSRLYQFAGNLEVAGSDGQQHTTVPLSAASLLLRGCNLRNTERAYGLVLFAGHDTKIFQNSTEIPSKRSQVEIMVDHVTLFMFALLFVMCMTASIVCSAWVEEQAPGHWYLAPHLVDLALNPSRPGLVGIVSFVVSFILYGYLIPISLYVSIEIIKIIQSMVFIGRDREMYHAETNTPALARTSNLNEELGMVNTVLTDKTGTLTRNVMEFFKCSIAGVAYGAGITEIERANAERHGHVLNTEVDPRAAQYRESFFNFYDERIMDGAWLQHPNAEAIAMFFRLLAVCHTVIPDGPQDVKSLKYEAESPDEAALVVAAKVFGFFFFKRTNTKIIVRERTATGTQDVEYEVLNVLEFNSTRKRMSIIARDSSGKIIIFCKGADTVIYDRLDRNYPDNEHMKQMTSQHMEEFGNAGLRTLCLSYAEVDPEWYAGWQAKFLEAKTSLVERDAKLAEVAELVERNLRLLGCTAIEDKLQEGVPQCIKKLADAGIRIWVLTGDKMETAINIGFACSLVTDDMQQFGITAQFPEVDNLEAAGEKEEAAQLANAKVEAQLTRAAEAIKQGSDKVQYALIIDGKALSYALSQRLSQQFLQVGLKCAAVICCRVSPLQKAQVTGLVRSHGDVTLAIGDGANDVGMIQRAHIGVGISGQEGMQAVMSSDFAIAQFRFLLPLLLVHGRWSYKRITRMINFFFYKNLLFGATLFIFDATSAFSGNYMYDDTYMTLYNVIFTALTPLVLGVFDRDVDRVMGYRYPSLYRQGQRNMCFDLKARLGWIFSAIYQSAIMLLLVVLGTVPLAADRDTGQPYGIYQTGILLFSVVIVTVHLQLVLIIEQWTFLHHLAIWGSQGIWWLYVVGYGAMPLAWSGSMYQEFSAVTGSSAQYWLYLVLVPIACLLPEAFFRMVKRHVAPEDDHIIQEIQALQARGTPARYQAHGMPSNKVAPATNTPGGTSAGGAVAECMAGSDIEAVRLSASRVAWRGSSGQVSQV